METRFSGLVFAAFMSPLFLSATNVVLAQEPAKPIPPPVLQGQPETPEQMYFKARQKERQNLTEEALQIYGDLARKYPKHYRTGCGLVGMGILLMNEQRYDEAVESFRRVLREFPEAKFLNGKLAAERAAYLVAICLYKKGDRDEAMAALDEAIKKYPDATAGDEKEGRPLADVFFDIAEKQDPGQPERKQPVPGPLPTDSVTRLYLVAGDAAKKDPDDALKKYEEVYTKYPQHELAAAALLNAGYILMNRGFYDEAIKMYQKVVQGYPDSHYFGSKKLPVAPDAAWLIGEAYYAKGDMPNAKKAFDFALQKFPDARLGSKLRSEVHADTIKKVNEAAKVLEGQGEKPKAQ